MARTESRGVCLRVQAALQSTQRRPRALVALNGLVHTPARFALHAEQVSVVAARTKVTTSNRSLHVVPGTRVAGSAMSVGRFTNEYEQRTHLGIIVRPQVPRCIDALSKRRAFWGNVIARVHGFRSCGAMRRGCGVAVTVEPGSAENATVNCPIVRSGLGQLGMPVNNVRSSNAAATAHRCVGRRSERGTGWGRRHRLRGPGGRTLAVQTPEHGWESL